MAERVNRRRRANIRARVSMREKQLLLEQKRAVGARTWREFMFSLRPLRNAGAVDLSKVARMTTAIAALQEGPRSLRTARAELLESVDRLARLSILNPERAELHRRGIESTLREIRVSIARIDVEIERAELAASPARDEIARVMRLVSGR